MNDLEILARIRGGFSEKGNTLLLGDNRNFVLWVKLDENEFLEVVFNPNNYPSFGMQTLSTTEAELATHINEHCIGYEIAKCAIAGVRYNDVGPYKEVEGEEEPYEITK